MTYYQVVEEICNEGIKSRFSKNQRINDYDISALMMDFKKYKYEIDDSLTKRRYGFFDYNWCGKKITLYTLDLIKIK